MNILCRALFVCILVITALLAGCSQSGDKILRYDLSGPVENLDPQFATEASARMLIGNLFEGLLVAGSEGEILPGAAEGYTVSADGLVYTFTLREGACWQNGAAVTSADFLYAFYRLFNRDALSPYAADFACIAGAQAILRGEAAISALGVEAVDARTLRFTLEYASPFFPELLTTTAAMPCNEEFFAGARGRYGLERALLFTNGPFYLERWDNTKYIRIRKSEAYASTQPVLCGGVNFYIGRGNPAALFAEGKADLAFISGEEAQSLKPRQGEVHTSARTVWCIVFNQSHPLWGNALLRQGLSLTLEREMLTREMRADSTPTEVLIPPAMRLLGNSYRDYAGEYSPLAFDPARGERLFKLGLANAELERLPATATLLVPETGNAPLYTGLVQQSWQKHLSVYINAERRTAAQVESALRTGDYQMLLMPFSPMSPDIRALLGEFSSTSPQNYFGYASARYDELLADMARATSVNLAMERCRQLETTLLLDAVVVPVYFETNCLAVTEGVRGVRLSPFAGELRFQHAVKD